MRILAALACLTLLAGCTPSAPESPSPTPSRATSAPSPSDSPTPSPSPTPSYPDTLPTDDPETAAIIQGWQEYWRVYEKFAADPSGFTDFTETQYVTIDEEARLILDSLAQMRELGIRSEGGLVFRDLDVSAVSSGSQGARSATITYCLDTTAQRVVLTETGGPFKREVPPTLIETATMVEGQDGRWRVAQIRNQEKQC